MLRTHKYICYDMHNSESKENKGLIGKISYNEHGEGDEESPGTTLQRQEISEYLLLMRHRKFRFNV